MTLLILSVFDSVGVCRHELDIDEMWTAKLGGGRASTLSVLVNVLDKMLCEKQFKSRMSIGFGSDGTIKEHSNKLQVC